MSQPKAASPAPSPAVPSSSSYLAAIADRVLVFDGAMGTNIQRYNLTPADFGGKELEGCNDNLVRTRPDVIQAIHESFLAVGCDVSLLDAGARGDPLIRRIDDRLQVEVRHHTFWDIHPPAADRRNRHAHASSSSIGVR